MKNVLVITLFLNSFDFFDKTLIGVYELTFGLVGPFGINIYFRWVKNRSPFSVVLLGRPPQKVRDGDLHITGH